MSEDVASTMTALLLNEDGYASKHSGTVLEAMEPYVRLGEIDVPVPEGSQVLVEVALASVNPSDVMYIKGLYGQPRIKDRPAGFEGVGRVVAAGDKAKGMVGQRVAFVAGRSGWGAWARYSLVDAAACIPVIDAVRDEDAAALVVNPMTALAMFDLVRQEGEKAFVLTGGASQLCKLMMAVARDEGYRPIAIVRRAGQEEHLKAAGATHVLNSDDPEFRSRLKQVMADEKPKVMLDAVTGPVASKIFHAMPDGARWVVYGRLDASETTIPEPGQLIFLHKRIEGFWLVDWMKNAGAEARMNAAREVQARYADGRWKTDVTATLKLEEAVRRLPEELAKPDGKVFISP
jgi:NADPH:quinone reductase-like Zn-dependent oxidoreductase